MEYRCYNSQHHCKSCDNLYLHCFCYFCRWMYIVGIPNHRSGSKTECTYQCNCRQRHHLRRQTGYADSNGRRNLRMEHRSKHSIYHSESDHNYNLHGYGNFCHWLYSYRNKYSYGQPTAQCSNHHGQSYLCRSIGFNDSFWWWYLFVEYKCYYCYHNCNTGSDNYVYCYCYICSRMYSNRIEDCYSKSTAYCNHKYSKSNLCRSVSNIDSYFNWKLSLEHGCYFS